MTPGICPRGTVIEAGRPLHDSFSRTRILARGIAVALMCSAVRLAGEMGQVGCRGLGGGSKTHYICGGGPDPDQPESQPAIDVPQWSTPGACKGRASPAAPTNRYQRLPPTPVAWLYPLQVPVGTSPIQCPPGPPLSRWCDWGQVPVLGPPGLQEQFTSGPYGGSQPDLGQPPPPQSRVIERHTSEMLE